MTLGSHDTCLRYASVLTLSVMQAAELAKPAFLMPGVACQVMEHHGEEFNQINVSTTFTHLADLVEKKPDLKDEVLGSEKFQTLLGEPFMCLQIAQ